MNAQQHAQQIRRRFGKIHAFNLAIELLKLGRSPRERRPHGLQRGGDGKFLPRAQAK